MDKRKGIILAIVLFLIIGLGTFVFAGGSEDEGSGNGTINPQPDGGDDIDPNDPADSQEEDDGNIEEGGNQGTGTTRPAGGSDNSDGEELVTDGEGEQNPEETVDYKALLSKLEEMVNSATNKDDLAKAEGFRQDNNITKTNIDALGNAEDSKTFDEIMAILTDETDPAITPSDLDGLFTNESVSVTITDDTKTTYTLTLNDEKVENADLSNLSAEGTYTLTVVDAAFNETVVTFTIDTTDPTISGVDVEYNNKSEIVKISDTNLSSITINGVEQELTGTTFEKKFPNDGTYTIVVKDKAGNENSVTFTIDKTNPLLVINGEVVEETDETLYFTEDIKVTVEEANLETFTSNTHDRTEQVLEGWNVSEGGYTFVITDKAGNKTTYKVVVDKTPIAVNHLYVLNNTHNDYNVSEENRYKVIGNGQDLYVEYVLKEEFTSTPILTIGGKEYEMTCDVASWNDELYKCDAHVTISEDMNLVNGEVIPFTITGVKDIAGNETVVTEKDTTVSDKYGKVVYDNDPAQSIWVYILNADEDHRTIIGNNQKLIVEINVNEELLVNPVITIGKYQVELTRRANDSRYIYSKTITIDADEMNLVHNENIAFTISVTDVAGKTTTLDNKNVTIHEENGYNQVKYDGKAPKYKQLGVLNVDHLRNDEDVTVAKTGDEIRVLFHFDEILDVNPKMTIGEAKTVYELKLVTDYENFAEYTYMADITLTKDMNLSDGALVYTIYGYADAAGNVGKTIKSTDEIKTYTKFPGVRIDNTKPRITVDKLNDNGYTNNGNVNIDDASEFDVVVKIDGEVRHEYSNTKRADLSWLGDGEYEIIVTDAAGNSNTIKFNLDTVAAKKHAVYLWANTESVVENIDGKDYVVYYVTNGDVVTATISVNEILGENPKFVIGYNGGSYEVPQDQVIFRELDDVEDFKYVYSAQITIPEDVKTENTELTLTVYNVVDKAGNVTNNGEAIGISNVNRIFVDTTDPEITLYKWFGDGNHQVVEPGVHNYYVLADATDANLAGMTLDGKAYTNEELICDNGTYEIVATDKAGNESEITFTIDREYATLSVNGDNYNTYDDKNINYYRVVNELTITGAEDGIVRLYKDDETLIDEKYSDAVIEEIKAYLAEDGKYKFHIIDNAGNNTYVLITVDDTVPTISKEYWNEDPIAFGSNFVEPSVSELISYSDNITEKENLIINEWYTFKALNSSSYVEADGIDTSAMGQYYHYFTVTDEAGNTSQRVSIGYYVTDLTAPKIKGVVDNGIYIATTSDYGWITGGILLKITDDTQYFDITFDGNHFLGVENENDANMFKNGFAYHEVLNGVDICATDKFGNESCVKNVTIIRDENVDFKSILENGGNIILPENTTINLNGTVEIPEGTTITGNSSSIINGKLSINAANVTLKNVNVKDGGSAVIVGPNATNLVIDGGNFETTGLEYGQGTVRLDFTGGPAYTNNVTIKNANINGALHILNYNGSLDGIYGNIINVTTIPNNPLIGLLVTTDDNTNYTEEDFNKLNENNTINMEYHEGTEDNYSAIQNSNTWEPIYSNEVK